MDRSRFRLRHCGALALAVLLITLGLLVAVAPPAAAVASPTPSGPWTRPVDGPVARGFDAPASRYGPGHRGVDLAVPDGTPVRAAGDGVVTFAGVVAGSLHVVVAHAGDLRTSYSFLATTVVRRGDAIRRGDVLGTTGGPAGTHPAVFHLGLRRGDRYLDPMLLFAPPDLARVVHLAPVRHAGAPAVGSWAVEALGVRRGLGVELPAVVRLPAGFGPDGPGGAEGGAFGRVTAWLQGGLEAARALTPAVPGASDAVAVASRAVDLAGAWRDCTAAPPDADGSGGSGHRLMAVGGIDSSTDRRSGATFALDPEALGYRADEVDWFSYAPDGGAYTAADTHGRIRSAARRLAGQLRALAAREPGREVDLVAHSQGGVVVDAFLQHEYDGADPTFPPLGTVVTLSSPHDGAPLATAAGELSRSRSGRAALATAAASGVPTTAAALADLREGSRTSRSLQERGLPDHIDLTTIGAVDDVVVPASHTGVPGATQVLVDARGLLDHGAVVDDPEALAAIRLALEARPPPCPGVETVLRGAVEPLVVARLERAAGAVGAAAGAVADAGAGLLP